MMTGLISGIVNQGGHMLQEKNINNMQKFLQIVNDYVPGSF